MNRAQELDHKEAVVAAWAAHPLKRLCAEPVDPLLAARVRAYLVHDLAQAERLLRDLFDRDQARAWWARWEGAVDHALLGTLAQGVPRRPRESPQDYQARLRAIAAHFTVLSSPTVGARLSDNGPTYYAGAPARSGNHPFRRRKETRRSRTAAGAP